MHSMHDGNLKNLWTIKCILINFKFWLLFAQERIVKVLLGKIKIICLHGRCTLRGGFEETRTLFWYKEKEETFAQKGIAQPCSLSMPKGTKLHSINYPIRQRVELQFCSWNSIWSLYIFPTSIPSSYAHVYIYLSQFYY